MLHELKFYRAAREDALLTEKLLLDKECNPRHVIVLFHDTLEFLFYECLQLLDIDIYENGQSTIGFNKALNMLIKAEYRPCYVATIREIQKLRGDAKHHAQDVSWDKVEQISQRWQVICVCLTWDLISPIASTEHFEWAANLYAVSQHSLYQRSRNKDWESACRHLMMAVAHKKCNIDKSVCRRRGEFPDHLSKEYEYLEGILGSGVGRQAFLPHRDTIREAVNREDWKESCGLLSMVYSALEGENPTQFDVDSAKFITPALALADASRLGRSGMSWCKLSQGDTEGYHKTSSDIEVLLDNKSSLVNQFGEPYYNDDGDRYWKWWEFVVFDGEEWHSFHLDYMFRISPESFHLSEDDHAMREKVVKLALKEFKKAAQQGAEADA